MSSDAQFIAYINNVSTKFNRYFSIFIFLFGTTGNILNILVLSQRSFRSNPCAIFFLVSSIANLIAILTGLTSRTLSGWAADLTNTDRCLCKLRAFVLNVARPVAFWLILLAAIDRWLLSSANVRYRQMSTLKNAKRSIIIVFILSIIIFCNILYCYEPNLINAPLKCYGATVLCRLVTDLTFTFVSIFIPVFLMLIFGLMTINNIRQSRSHIEPGNTSTATTIVSNRAKRRQHLNKNDYRLLMMLLLQILLLIIFGLPLGIQKLYATITMYRPSTNIQVAIDNFIYSLVLLLNFLANGMPFYIYTLVGGNTFRKALFKLLVAIRQKISRLRRMVHL
ncbi:unnamed protein product [Rotaria sp. Silwood1]|nr:unnamed protein product [Rotaria sp. Silwood1]CAF1324194.1 unnamed protein product [Rotaria sp. Silwood1]CAF1346521.1 unnamed protein product [Rotaria sp. Silwood1]CAF3489494.1 unnamed protein product [Rotaria sp. Silwood1]CAF3547888.1 unnamed protein product [Rotaria sp. Silwood1]